MVFAQSVSRFVETVGRVLTAGVRTVSDLMGTLVDALVHADPLTWLAIVVVALLLWGVFRQ